MSVDQEKLVEFLAPPKPGGRKGLSLRLRGLAEVSTGKNCLSLTQPHARENIKGRGQADG